MALRNKQTKNKAELYHIFFKEIVYHSSSSFASVSFIFFFFAMDITPHLGTISDKWKRCGEHLFKLLTVFKPDFSLASY
jgi:hypothetical protein